MNARAGALPDDQVDTEILHRGIENFFERRLQAMNFIEKEKIPRVKRREYGREIAFFFEERPGADFDRRTHFIGEDLRERGLPEAGWPVEQHVIERVATIAGGIHGDFQVFFYARLADEVFNLLRADGGVEARVFLERLA